MQDSSRRFRRILFNALTTIVSLALAAYVIWCLRPLILPVTLGILLAYLFRPFKTAFKYRWLPNSLRIAIIFTALTGSLLVGIKFVKNNIPNDQEKLELMVRFKYKFNEKFGSMMNINPATGKGSAFYNLIAKDINPLRDSLNGYLEFSPEQREMFLNTYGKAAKSQNLNAVKYYNYFLEDMKRAPASSTVTMAPAAAPVAETRIDAPNKEESFLKILVDIISIWFLLPIVFIFVLIDDGNIVQYFIKLLPNRYFELALTVKEQVDEAIGQYLRGMSLECALVGISLAAGLFVVGVPLKMALLIGFLSGVATAVPFLGPVIGLGFGLAYTLIAEDIHPLLGFMTIENIPVAVIIVNLLVLGLDNFVFQPFVLGGAVDLHPLVIILGLMGASMLFGVAGVLLGIPAIVVAKVVIQDTYRGLKAYRII